MQKSKILQTFSVIGLTAFCSIQSAEAWNKKVEFEIGPLPENQQAMSCTGLAQIMLEWGGEQQDAIVSAAYTPSELGAEVVQDEAYLDLKGRFKTSVVRTADVGGDLSLEFDFASSHDGPLPGCKASTIGGERSYTITAGDVGAEWGVLLDRVWPRQYVARLNWRNPGWSATCLWR